MPLDAVTLQSDLEALFAAPPPTAAACAGLWAAAMSAYAAGVVPPSLTVAAAASALSSSLAGAFASPAAAPALFDAAFAAFAGAVGAGMAPAFTATPPPAPLNVGALLALEQPTHGAAAAAFATLIDEWFHTGAATLVAPPFTVVPWT